MAHPVAAISEAKVATFLNFCCLKTTGQMWLNSVLFLTGNWSLLVCSHETRSVNLTKWVQRKQLQFFFWIFFLAWKAEVYTPLGLASDLKPRYIISSPDSLWLRRRSFISRPGRLCTHSYTVWNTSSHSAAEGRSLFYSMLSEAATGRAVTPQTHSIWERQVRTPKNIEKMR